MRCWLVSSPAHAQPLSRDYSRHHLNHCHQGGYCNGNRQGLVTQHHCIQLYHHSQLQPDNLHIHILQITLILHLYVKQRLQDSCKLKLERRRRGNRTQLKCSCCGGQEERLDHVRNVAIWKEAHVYPMAEFLGGKRLRWLGHLRRQDKDEATERKILQMTVDGKRNRGRPKLRWRDLVKEDMARNQMPTEMAEDQKHWHVMTQAGTLRSVEADR